MSDPVSQTLRSLISEQSTKVIKYFRVRLSGVRRHRAFWVDIKTGQEPSGTWMSCPCCWEGH